MEQALEDLAARVRAARKVVVLSGAGISVASGIRTYRGAGGMWSDPVLLAAHQADALPGSLPVVCGPSRDRCAPRSSLRRPTPPTSPS